MPVFLHENFGLESMAQLYDCASAISNANGGDVRLIKSNRWSDDQTFNGDMRKWREKMSICDAGPYETDTNIPTRARKPVVPFVSLYNILLPSKSSTVPIKSDFLNYLDLASNHSSTSSISNKSKDSVSSGSVRQRTLRNSQNVPFSSNLGMKLLKDWHTIPPEIHEKKLERLERYLVPVEHHVNSAASANQVSYEVTFNKNEDCEHFYVFPTKTFHDKRRLTPKARHLLETYCRPCSVLLPRLKMPILKPSNTRLKKQRHANKSWQRCAHQKENEAVAVPQRELRVLLDNCRVANENKSVVANPRIDSVRSVVLKARNENAVPPTSTSNTKPPCQNVVNASVILTPLNGIFERSHQKGITKNEAVSNSNSSMNRRLSPRLHIANNVQVLQ